VVGGVQLSPLGTAATNRPIVPAPGVYDDRKIGEMIIGRGNRSTRRTCPSAALSTTDPTRSVRMRTQTEAVGSQRLTA
jgi:hypothetical protein